MIALLPSGVNAMEGVNRKVLRPVEYPALVRVGCPDGDGGYVIPEDLIGSTSVLISLGLGTNWTFDEDFLRRNPRARLIGVDHTVHPWYLARLFFVCLVKIPAYTLLLDRAKAAKWTERLKVALRYRRFFAPPNRHVIKRVAKSDDRSDISVGTLLAMAPTSAEHDVFVKMDIEGFEYEVVPALVAARGRINGLAVEFHYVDRDPAPFNTAIARLLEHFHIVHIHASGSSPYDEVHGFPAFVEITFVNRSLFHAAPRPCMATYPRASLDVPGESATAHRTLRFD